MRSVRNDIIKLRTMLKVYTSLNGPLFRYVVLVNQMQNIYSLKKGRKKGKLRVFAVFFGKESNADMKKESIMAGLRTRLDMSEDFSSIRVSFL